MILENQPWKGWLLIQCSNTGCNTELVVPGIKEMAKAAIIQYNWEINDKDKPFCPDCINKIKNK